MWPWWTRRAWRRRAANARWLEIVPPVTATPTATIALWRLLATLLPAPRPWRRPARLVWEVHSTATRTRCGLWVPPGVNPTAVHRVLGRAWPGVRVAHTKPPTPPAGRTSRGLFLHPTRSERLPLLDDPTPARWRDGAGAAECDPLRAVYDALASAGRTGGGLLQVVVARAPQHRAAALGRASLHPSPSGRRPLAWLAGGAAAIVQNGLACLLMALAPGRFRGSPRGSGDGPSRGDLAGQIRVKAAGAPHLLVAVHTVASGPSPEAALAAAADITGGFGLLSAHLGRRRLPRAHGVCLDRWAPRSRMFLATVAEVAALAGLPAEPAAHGLPQAASRRRAPGVDIWSVP